MPCNMMDGWTDGISAQAKADKNEQRIAALEQAMCALCKSFPAVVEAQPDLAKWWENHQKQRGHHV